MPVEYRTGDLFEYQGSLAHGVNAAGVMGKGIAVTFKKKYMVMFGQYREKCKKGTFLMGSIFPYHQWVMGNNITFLGVDPSKEEVFKNVHKVGGTWSKRQFWIYNLCIKSHWSLPADEVALWATLRAMVKHMEANNVTEVAMPRIGAGLGQLDWETVVKPIIEEVGNGTNCTLIVYSQ